MQRDWFLLIPSDKKKLFKINIEGTANLVNVAIETGHHGFCACQFCECFGQKRIRSNCIDEEKKWEGNEVSRIMESANIMVKWKSGGVWAKDFLRLL